MVKRYAFQEEGNIHIGERISLTRVKGVNGTGFQDLFEGDFVGLLEEDSFLERVIKKSVGNGPGYRVHGIYDKNGNTRIELRGPNGNGFYYARHFVKL